MISKFFPVVSDSVGPQVKPELLALLSRAPGDQMLMVPDHPEKPPARGAENEKQS